MADGLDVRFLEADVSAVDTDLGGPYALIVDGNCLHCIVGDARGHALANVHRALADDGVLYVSSICSRDVDRVILGSNCLERWAGTLASLERELAHAGLRTIGSHEWMRDGPANHATLYAVRDDAPVGTDESGDMHFTRDGVAARTATGRFTTARPQE